MRPEAFGRFFKAKAGAKKLTWRRFCEIGFQHGLNIQALSMAPYGHAVALRVWATITDWAWKMQDAHIDVKGSKSALDGFRGRDGGAKQRRAHVLHLFVS